MNVSESVFITGFTGATATSSFTLKGGTYGFTMVASGSTSFALQNLGPDGSTWLNVATQGSITTVYIQKSVPPGTYRIGSLTTNVTYQFSITHIPDTTQKFPAGIG